MARNRRRASTRITVQKILARRLEDAISSKDLEQLEATVQCAEDASFYWNDDLATAKTIISLLKEPSMVITLQALPQNIVRCTNISGSELAMLNANKCKTLGALRSVLALQLSLPIERLRLVLADGGLLPISADAASLSELTSSASDICKTAGDGWPKRTSYGLPEFLQRIGESSSLVCYPRLSATFLFHK